MPQSAWSQADHADINAQVDTAHRYLGCASFHRELHAGEYARVNRADQRNSYDIECTS